MTLTPPIPWRVADGARHRRDAARAARSCSTSPAGRVIAPASTWTCGSSAEDGYQAQRSYSIASAPEDRALGSRSSGSTTARCRRISRTCCSDGDGLELRGPIGGYFVWDADDGGPLLLVAGGSGVVPLLAMLRHRARADQVNATRPHTTALFRAHAGAT